MNSVELVAKLKPLITTFSEAIRYKYKHRDSLKVGGKIVANFSVPDFSKDSNDDDASYMQYIQIDDAIGQISLIVPGQIYDELSKKYSFDNDTIVIAEGKLLDPEGELKKQIDNKVQLKGRSAEDMPNVTLLCWNVEPYDAREGNEMR